MATSLTQIIASSEDPSVKSFLAVQSNCSNQAYFTTGRPKERMSSWEGYYYAFNVVLDKTSIGAGGGTITVTYTTQRAARSGKTPTITTTLGTVSNITTTDSTGKGTAVITVPSRATTPGDARTGTITVTCDGAKGTATFTQAHNNPTTLTQFTVDSVSPTSKSVTAATGSYTLSWRQLKRTQYTWPSGSPVTYSDWAVEANAGISSVSSNQTWVTVGTKKNSDANGYNSITISYGANQSSSSRSATITITNGSSGSTAVNPKTCTISQAAHTISSVAIKSVSVYGGTLTNPASYAAAGATKSVAGNAAPSCTVTLTLTYNSGYTTDTTSYSSYGTLSGPTYSWSVASGAATLTSSNAASLNVTMPNNTTTSTRSSVVRRTSSYTFTLSSTYGGATKSGAGTADATCSQGAGSIVYGSWTGGAVTFNSTSALSAGADSRTVYINPWSRVWTWNGVTGSGSTEYYTGKVTVTENGAYTSLSASSVSFATDSSTRKSLTLSKTTCGTNEVAATTVTVTANPDTDGPSTTTGSLTQTANTIATYGAVTISTFAYANVGPSSSAMTASPSVSASQTLTYTSTATKAGTITYSYSESTAHANAAVNQSTGVVTWDANSKVTSDRVVGVTVTATGQGSKSATKATTSTCLKDYITTYVTPTVSIGSGLTAGASSATVSCSGNNTWKTGATSAASISWSITTNGNSRFSKSGNTLSHSTMGTYYGTDTVAITAVNDGDTSKKATATKSVSNTITITSVTSTPGSLTNTSFGAGKDTKDVASTGASASAVLTFTSGSKVTTNYGSTDYGTWSFHGYSASTNQTWATVNSTSWDKTNITASSRGTTAGDARTATLTRSEAGFTFTLKSDYGGASKRSTGTSCTCTLTQVANAADASSKITAYGTPSVSIGSGITAAGGSATITRSVSNTRTYYYTSGSAGRTASEAGTVNLSIQSQFYSTSSSATSGTAITRYSLSGTTLSHSSMGTTVAYDYCIVKAVNAGDSSKTATATNKVQNAADASSKITAYGTPSVSIGSGITAAGGSATITRSVSNTRTYYYTSGSAGRTASEAGTVNLSIQSQFYSTSSSAASGTAITRYSLSGTTLSHTSMAKNVGYDFCVIKATNAGDTSKTATATNKVQNSVGAYYVTTYGTPVVSVSSNNLTAGGGSIVFTASVTNSTRRDYTSTSYDTSTATGSIGEHTISTQFFTTSSTATSGSTLSRFSNSGWTVSHTSMGTNVGYDVVRYFARNAGDTSKVGYSDYIRVQNTITVTGTTPSYGSWVYNWTTTGNSTRTRSVTYTDTYASGSTANRAGTAQTETGGTRYLVLSSEDYANKVPVYTFPANGSGSTTLTTLSHDYWGSTFITQNTITGVSCSCTGFTCSVSGSTLTITASSRGTTVGDYIKNTIVSSKSGFTARSGYTFVAQEANVRSLSSVYTVPYKPDSSWITDVTGSGSSTNWSTVPVSGGYLKSRAYANYTHTSGSPLNDQIITHDAAFTWSGNTNPTWITAHVNGGYYVNPNGGNANTRTSTGTYSYTYNNVTKTCTEAITQAKDTYTDKYEYKTELSLSSTSVTAAAGSITATIKVYRRTVRDWSVGSDQVIADWSLIDTTPTVTDNVDWASVGTVSKSSTGTYTATVSYNANGRNTSSRTATITATANSKSATASFTQAKDTYTDNYEYKTELSLSSSSVTVAAGSITATIKVYRRTVRDWSVGSDQEIAAWALIDTTPTVTDNVDWASVGTVSKSSTGTYTTTVSYNANGGNANTRTATITASANSKSATASFTQAKDTYTDKYEYKTELSLSSTSVTAAAGSITATIKVYRRTVRDWSVGSDQEIAAWVLIDTTPTVTDNVDWASVGTVSKSSTGTYTATVSYNANTSTSSTRTVTVTATANSKSATASMTQAKDSIKTYGGVTVSLSYANVGPSTSDMTASPSISYSQTITYVSGSTRAGTVSIAKWEVSGTDNSYGTLNTSNGKVVWKANPQVMSDRSETIKVTVTGEGSKTNSTTATSTCKADSVKSIEAVVMNTSTSSCHWYYSPGSSSSPIAAAGGTASPVGNGACKFTFTSGSTATQSSAGTHYGGTLSFSRTYSGSATGFAVNATSGVVTASNNTTSTQKRSVNVTSKLTVTWGSKSDDLSQSRDCYQAAGTMYYRVKSVTASSTSLIATYDGWESVYVTMQKTISGSTPNNSNTWSNITGTEAQTAFGSGAPFYAYENQAGTYDSEFIDLGNITLLNGSGVYYPSAGGAAITRPSMSAEAKWRVEVTWSDNPSTTSSRKNTVLILRESGNYDYTGEGKNYITLTQVAKTPSVQTVPMYLYGCNDTGTDIYYNFDGSIMANGNGDNISYFQSSGGCSLNTGSYGLTKQLSYGAFDIIYPSADVYNFTVTFNYSSIDNTLNSGRYKGCKMWLEVYGSNNYLLGTSNQEQITSNSQLGSIPSNPWRLNVYYYGTVTSLRLCFHFEDY